MLSEKATTTGPLHIANMEYGSVAWLGNREYCIYSMHVLNIEKFKYLNTKMHEMDLENNYGLPTVCWNSHGYKLCSFACRPVLYKE
jgi:hypothetical protein